MKIILLIVLAILLIVILIYSRCPYIGCLTLITGALKSGKTLMGLRCALRKYKSAVLRWKLSCLWMRIIHKPEPEEPLFYTNISVAGVRFVPVTLDILYRRVRVSRKSVMFLSETSLIADSMTVKDALLNEEINVFFKLYGHESHGGKCIIETQNVLDNHYAITSDIKFILNEQRKQNEREKEKRGRGRYHQAPESIVFPFSAQQTSREFKKLCGGHHLHELRHTFITRCCESGVNPSVCQQLVGHSTGDMIMNVYMHVMDEFKRREAAKFTLFPKF